MNIVIDTNILVRIMMNDDAAQASAALKTINNASEICIPTHVLCEYSWTLSSFYKRGKAMIAEDIRDIMNLKKVVIKMDEAEAGLRFLDAGGDFADGVIAYTGGKMASGPATFVSFDRKTISLLHGRGVAAMIPPL
ncbi:MAG: type II toxin-antitoxin system VapC family toxin [Azonexus sp.]|jgi:predicted nucleic-acid-binding protein|nr:type II toxin-antitoxin system VapC family toxin [Azonexus sp.]